MHHIQFAIRRIVKPPPAASHSGPQLFSSFGLQQSGIIQGEKTNPLVERERVVLVEICLWRGIKRGAYQTKSSTGREQ